MQGPTERAGETPLDVLNEVIERWADLDDQHDQDYCAGTEEWEAGERERREQPAEWRRRLQAAIARGDHGLVLSQAVEVLLVVNAAQDVLINTDPRQPLSAPLQALQDALSAFRKAVRP